jgi:hypothetical protein
MNKVARRVAARWALKQAMGDWQPVIPDWVVPWAESGMQRFLVAKGELDLDRTVQVDPPKFDLGDPLYTNPNRRKYEPVQVFNPKLHEMPHREVLPGQDLFDDAKLSVEIMLPRVLRTLRDKFRDPFYMNATQQRLKLYYYFSAHPAMETVALMVSLKNGVIALWLGYIPHKLMGGADFKRGIHETVVVHDPELAGLALMRLLRKLLSRVEA